MPKLKDINRILISRTDAIGDVILTIPLAKILKENYPQSEIIFLGQSYTQAVIECCDQVDEFIDYSALKNQNASELAAFLKDKSIDLAIHVFPNKKIAKACKLARIPYRLGTRNRLFHLLTCNIRPALSRKNSDLHEAQLNARLIAPVVESANFSAEDLGGFYSFGNIPEIDAQTSAFLDPDKKNIVLHPRSKGSAREWGLENFRELAAVLKSSGKYNVIITGTQAEGDSIREVLLDSLRGRVRDTTGKLSLRQLIALISQCDGLVAASTGPLHIASACGIHALGLYIMTRPMHPGRWRPLGPKAEFIVKDELDLSEDSIERIRPKDVFERIENW